jgi:hypothetical protein
MPVALVAPDKHITVAPVCGARTLAEGRPPMGIACAQQDVARVYPLPDDPERCLEDFCRAGRRARPPDGRAPRPPGGVGAASWSSAATTSLRRAERGVACLRRPYRATQLLIAAGVVFFLGVSLLLARYLAPRTTSATPSTPSCATRRAATHPRCSGA